MSGIELNLINTMQQYGSYYAKIKYTHTNKDNVIDKVAESVADLFDFFLTAEAHTEAMGKKLGKIGIDFQPLPFKVVEINKRETFKTLMMDDIKQKLTHSSKCYDVRTEYHPDKQLSRLLSEINYISAQQWPGNNIFPYKIRVFVDLIEKKETIELEVVFQHSNYFKENIKNDGEIELKLYAELNLIKTMQQYASYYARIKYTDTNKDKVINKVAESVADLFAFFLTAEAHTEDMGNKLGKIGIDFQPLPFKPVEINKLKIFKTLMMDEMKRKLADSSYRYDVRTEYHPDKQLAHLLSEINYVSVQQHPSDNTFPYNSRVFVDLIEKEIIKLEVTFQKSNHLRLNIKNDGEIELKLDSDKTINIISN